MDYRKFEIILASKGLVVYLCFMKELKENFVVQCAACKQRYTNHAGSTPCCGSVAELLDENIEPMGS